MPQKKKIFWSNKIEVLITPFIEMQELSNYGHMTITIWFEASNKILLVAWQAKNCGALE